MTPRKILRVSIMLLFAGACAPAAKAQPGYTLDECVELALRNNTRMKNAANDLTIAREMKKSAFTKYFPSVSATGGGFISSNPLLQMDIVPGMSMERMKNGLVGGVTASMPLFAGGRIINGNKLADVNVEKYRLLNRQSVNQVRLTTEQYFWQVATLREKLKTLDVVGKQLDRLLGDASAAVEAGVANRNDLLQVQLKQNETQSTRITVENALSLSRRLLAQYIGAEADSIDISFAFDDSLPPSPATLYRSPEASLGDTPEYNLLRANVKAARIEHKLSVGKQLPSVAIGGGYMYENLMEHNHTFWLGFATVSVPLSGWWGGTHDIKQQKIAVNTAENDLKDKGELLLIRMESAWNDLNDAYRQVGIARRSIEQSAENLRLNTDYYHAGTCTMADLLDAQTLYRQSRDKYVEARMQYEVRKREYLQATGR